MTTNMRVDARQFAEGPTMSGETLADLAKDAWVACTRLSDSWRDADGRFSRSSKTKYRMGCRGAWPVHGSSGIASRSNGTHGASSKIRPVQRARCRKAATGEWPQVAEMKTHVECGALKNRAFRSRRIGLAATREGSNTKCLQDEMATLTGDIEVQLNATLNRRAIKPRINASCLLSRQQSTLRHGVRSDAESLQPEGSGCGSSTASSDTDRPPRTVPTPVCRLLSNVAGLPTLLSCPLTLPELVGRAVLNERSPHHDAASSSRIRRNIYT
jgi:hypothetical protein